jgi:hypothetical protein
MRVPWSAAPRALAAAGLTALCACGGSSGGQQQPPGIPADLASDLAARSERVAAALDAGAPCAALAQARSLQSAVSRAIASAAVPLALREELRVAVERLAGRIECAPPPAPEAAAPAEPERDGEGKGHGKKANHGKGHDGD